MLPGLPRPPDQVRGPRNDEEGLMKPINPVPMILMLVVVVFLILFFGGYI
jgi:hypothetical protein